MIPAMLVLDIIAEFRSDMIPLELFRSFTERLQCNLNMTLEL